MQKRHLIPLALFLALASTLAVGLQRANEPVEPVSPLVGKPVPAFNLAQLQQPEQRFTPAALKGKVWLLNAWASWCASCRIEHPLLVELARRGDIVVVGYDFQDQRPAALKWLESHGNPYRTTVVDSDGRAGIDLGIVALPETLVIDAQGTVRDTLTGGLTPELIRDRLLPLIARLQKEKA